MAAQVSWRLENVSSNHICIALRFPAISSVSRVKMNATYFRGNFATYRFVFESTTWLLVKGKLDRATSGMKSIAKINGVELSEEACHRIEVIGTDSHVEQLQSWRFI